MGPLVIDQLLELDNKYTQRLRIANNKGVIRNLAIIFAHSGDSWLWLVGLLIAWWLGTDEWKTLTLVMLFSILATAVVVLVMKFTIRRRRPEGDWGDIYRKTDPHSFPSGHAARAGLIAVIALGLGPTWFGLLMLVWAPLVILARVAMGVHYLSDVLAGALLGTLIGISILILMPLFAFLV